MGKLPFDDNAQVTNRGLRADTMGAALIRHHPKDNVLIAREPLTLGVTVNADGISIKVRTQVPAGHKIAARKITANEIVLKYDRPMFTRLEQM